MKAETVTDPVQEQTKETGLRELRLDELQWVVGGSGKTPPPATVDAIVTGNWD